MTNSGRWEMLRSTFGWLSAARRLTERYLGDRQGTIAIKFAMILPALAFVSLGAVDLMAVVSDKSKLQDIADTAALTGAGELGLGIDPDAPIERAHLFAQALLDDWARAPRTIINVSAVEASTDGRGIRVALRANRPSFFGNLLPPGGWNIGVHATASSLTVSPLCVLAHGKRLGDVLVMSGSAKLQSPACLIHANDQIAVAGTGQIVAAMTQSVGRATGNIVAAPQTGAEAVDDPYLDLDPRPPGTCRASEKVVISTSTTLRPGLHCDDLVVTGAAVLTLAAGEHYFVNNRLELRGNARLSGTDVVMVFDQSAFDFLGSSRVALSGRRSGPLSGFVIIGLRPSRGWCRAPPADDHDDDDDDDDRGPVVTPSRPKDCRLGSEFLMASDNVESLDGVIYMPVSRLIVEGRNEIAEASDWTVMIVESLEVRGSPTLTINADYGNSPVPVPAGLGRRDAELRLLR